MALVCLSILVYFLREGRDGFHWWKTFLAPLLGFAAISFAFYLMMKNRAGITFGAYEGWVKYVPIISLLIFLAGCALAVGYRLWARKRYDEVGKFLHEEA